ncbi:MAG: isoprenyl transferase, partial [Candidatus Nanopelagicales bacterium]
MNNQPNFKELKIPKHIAIVMDGNGRWAKQRNLPRTKGHEAGESALLEAVHGALAAGVKNLSAYAFSTENWRRSPEEVKFLMGFNREVIHRRLDEMHDLGVKVRWVGREQKLYRSVKSELLKAEEKTKANKNLTLYMCVNYGGRAEIIDAINKLMLDVKNPKLKIDKVTEKIFNNYLDEPKMPEVDLFLRTSGEQRTSNFLLWQSAYAEMVFLDVLWPDFTREHLYQAIEMYSQRDRRFGGA